MPKASGIPKSVLADIGKLKNRIASLEKGHTSLAKELKTSAKNHSESLRKLEQTIATLGKKAVKKEKRKPSPYNLFLKDKMSQGMSMIDAVKAWKEKGGMSSSTRQSTSEWQQTTQQY